MLSIFRPKSFLFLALALIAITGAAHAQSLTIVNGNGQLTGSSGIANQPLTVQLLDATGKPFTGQVIGFVTTQSSTFSGSINTNSTITDANGQASVTFLGANVFGTGVGVVQTGVIASYGALTAVFTETTVINVTNSTALAAQVNLLYPTPFAGTVISGSAGSAGTTPIQAQVSLPGGGGGIPNIELQLITESGSTGTISCKEGPYVLTNSTGIATCTPLFGKIGSGTFTVLVGGVQSFPRNSFTVTPGNPSIITVQSGNNQSGVPGQTLPLPIVGVVTDVAGNTLSGVTVNFISLTPGGATFVNPRNVSDANGRVSSTVVLGNVAGPIQLEITDAAGLVTTPAIFTATVSISISGLTKIGGDGQTAIVNAPFGQPLVVQITNATSQPVPSATVTFALIAGAATLSSTTAITDANGQASIGVVAGPTPGPVNITASAGGLTQTFSLTVNPSGPVNFSYFNGASNQVNSLSPGSIVTITGQGLVSSNLQGVAAPSIVGPLPYQVAGVSVTIGNVRAPIFNVSNLNGNQSVTVQVPFEVAAGVQPINIAVQGGGSTNAFVTVLPVSPGIFQTVQSDGVSRAVALRPDGTVVTPANPAVRGENVRIYLTGLGPVSPTVSTGNFSPSGSADPAVTDSLVAGINNAGVTLVQAIYARNLVGVYELTVQIPPSSGAPSGSVSLSFAVQGPNGYVYSNPSSIVLQ